MAPLFQWVSEHATITILFSPLLLLVAHTAWKVVYNLYFHPLAKYPGPRLAAITGYARAYSECVQRKSNVHEHARLHSIYGPVIRIAPNELHFASPSAYNDIYNNKNRWDKEETLYHSFGEDESSFGYLYYQQAKERRDILLRMFSSKAIESSQGVVKEKVRYLCSALARQNETGKSCNVLFAYRCMTMDVLTYLCYGNSINAMNEPDFKAPLVEAMHIVTPLSPMLQHFSWYKALIHNCPPKISLKISPETAGLVRMQQLLKGQIDQHVSDPSSLDHLPHSTTIFHVLLNPEAYRDKKTPTARSLYQESQALMFGGVETTANALMIGTFYMLQNPEMLKRLKKELYDAWPVLEQEPELRDLEKLTYLNAVLKETHRIGPSVPGGLPRVVPASGAIIAGEQIPGGTIVSEGSWFIHRNESLFEKPDVFNPDRWLGPQANELEKWLISFSRGPRSCIGMNLAWCELRICFAHLIRKFDMEIDPTGLQADHVPFRGVFSPYFPEPHLKVFMKPIQA